MSWLFGYTGEVTPPLRAAFAAVHDEPLCGAESAGYYVQSGGLEDTCHHGSVGPGPAQWFAAGIGLDPGSQEPLSRAGWNSLASDPESGIAAVDGHVVLCKTQADGVHLYTDQLGTRTLFYAPYAGGHLFATRLDWLCALVEHTEIDFEAFGSSWITFNQLSTRSQVKGIERLGPGGHLVLSGSSARRTERAWSCPVAESDSMGSAFAERLAGYCKGSSLGLSGGLDSRLLLALGAEETHVWGPADHPDVRLAQHIARSERIVKRYFHEESWDTDALIARLRMRAQTTQVIAPASSVLDMDHYPLLHKEGRRVIDGGFGEVARRQFMNRLLRLGKGWGNPAQVLPFVRVQRAELFSLAVAAQMKAGTLEDIAMHRDALPGGLDAANAVDLIGVRTRLPNFFGLEQNRLDALAVCFMPFAQPSVLRALFQVPLGLRRNGKLFKQLIRRRRPGLARYPLVKGTTEYPFWLSTMGAAFSSRFKKKLGKAYRDPRPHVFLEAIKPWVLDAAHSEDVRTYAPADHAAVINLVTSYYSGQTSLAGAVDWWVTFEMWRRVVHGRA